MTLMSPRRCPYGGVPNWTWCPYLDTYVPKEVSQAGQPCPQDVPPLTLCVPPRMASTQLTPVLATASAATSRGVKALEGLANALGKPEEMPKAQEEAEEAVAEAERTLRRLDQVQMATLATKAAEEPGLEATSIYRALEAFTKARVEELEREQKRNRRQQKLLVVLRNVALGLLLLCTPLREYGPGGARRSQ